MFASRDYLIHPFSIGNAPDECKDCKGAHSDRQSHGEFRGSRAASRSDRLDPVYSIINGLARARHIYATDRVLADQTGYELP